MSGRSPRELRIRRHLRVRKRVGGSAERPRLSIFRSNIQAIAGKHKIERAKAVGQLIAERAKAAGIEKVVFDRGGFKYHGRVQALAEAAREAGLSF